MPVTGMVTAVYRTQICSAEGRQLEEGMRQPPGERYPAEQATGRPFCLRA